MSKATIRDPEAIRRDCALKVRQIETNCSFRAILACLLGEEWTSPRIIELRLLPQRNLLARLDGELIFKEFTATEHDLIHSLHKIAKGADLDGDELGYLLSEIAKITHTKCTGTSDQSGRQGAGG